METHNAQGYRLGIDIGSTTIKAALLDENNEICYSCYRRHCSDVRGEISVLFSELVRDLRDVKAQICLTGSAGLGVAEALELGFVQEVVAGACAVRTHQPDADVIIELGGEDAKITFMKPVVSQRMNGTCAGGTGAFIDQMATLLQTDAAGLNLLAKNYKTLHTIASRCGVFAKSDIQPLLNEGVKHEDLAASILQAVVNQTIAGLACGQPIAGTVVFLGGPLTYMSELRAAFERTLGENVSNFVTPAHAEVFVALGAAMNAKGDYTPLESLSGLSEKLWRVSRDIPRLEPLFQNRHQLEDFETRHAGAKARRAEISQADGACFLGIDAGSTTIKSVLTDADGSLLHTYYSHNEGAPLPRVQEVLDEIYKTLPEKAFIGGVTVTGYGEQLLKTAITADRGEIETVCHTRAAQEFAPEVDFILDIGGQDMKCMKIKDGILDSVLLNEACSSGCGSFISSFAETLGLSTDSFAQKALESEHPVDLGTRCTVFMNSRVKQAQKEGAGVGDISCGLSYSVVRNSLFKVIKLQSPEQMGKTVLVQGGTFLNNAILRAFELVAGRHVIRPDIAGLMGAYGAALLAMDDYRPGSRSAVLAKKELSGILPQKVQTVVCTGCANACKLTVSEFSGKRRLLSGFRCEKGEGKPENSGLPNLVEEKYEKLFSYSSLDEKNAPYGKIGLPRALNIYENYPLWHTFFTELGFSVVLSRHSDHSVFEQAMSTIPSESICYPAKLVHGHIHDLVKQGIDSIFYPCVVYERKENKAANNYFNCPIVQSYPEVIHANMDILTQNNIIFLKPFLSLQHRDKMADTLTEALSRWNIPRAKIKAALNAGFDEMRTFFAHQAKRGSEVLTWLRENGKTGIVLAGRPYHIDPEIHHGLPRMISSLGFAVLTEDSIAELSPAQRPLRVFDQWMYHTRLYDAANTVAGEPNLQLVQINSFGCGLDAISTDQVQEILSAAGKVYTVLKMDETSSLGAARIRMRSLAASLSSRKAKDALIGTHNGYVYKRAEFTKKMKGKHTILAPQMSPVHFELVEAALQRAGYSVNILKEVEHADIDAGLKFVNNDACYPTIVVIGQLMRAVLSGKYDTDNISIFLTQTGGGCRATNYVALMRRALREAGMPHIPIVSLSVGGIEKNPGFKFTPALIDATLKCLIIGDLLQSVLLRVRPYEKSPGSANGLYRIWLDRCTESFSGVAPMRFAAMAQGIIADFEELPLLDIPRKPRVGLVGEILVKFHPDANNNAVTVIEEEGCEAVIPGLLGFLQYCFMNDIVKHEILGTSGKTARIMGLIIRLVYQYENTVKKHLKNSLRFIPEAPIGVIAEKASEVLSVANQCGEGWLLTGEMVELIENGVPNIICVQPFACLPNHVTGKGMLRKLRELFPQSNIVPIDYDPGASEVNQLNRIKLMISGAFSEEA
ncbi:MAG: 2-hydroxyacyl-CoA dehydratase [Oscillospiraceae bacterium]|nr:2-hydroxyacyl-CoA dehydratase [Oscillospiraceae bacterium]